MKLSAIFILLTTAFKKRHIKHYYQIQYIYQFASNNIHALKTRKNPTLNIFEPVDFEGHNAAYLGSFSKQFGDCILEFLDPQNTTPKETCLKN